MTRVALSVTIPAATNGTDLARSQCARARSSSTPPVTVANAMPSQRGPSANNDPAAAPIAPSAAAAENAATRLVSQLLARIALALKRCGADVASSRAPSGSDVTCEDSPASTIDSGADASTKTSDIAADAAPIAGSGTAVTAPTTAAAASTVAKHANDVKTVAQQPITRMTVADVAAAAVASSAFGAASPPGTASKPASATNPPAARPNVGPAVPSRNTRWATSAASSAMKPATAATPAQSPRRTSSVPKAVPIKIAAPVAAKQLAASAPISRAACRVQGRAVEASDTDTASATSSKRGGVKTVDELVSISIAPSRISNWASVCDGSSAIFPGSESWCRMATGSARCPHSAASMSTIGGISDPIGTAADSAKST